MKIITDLNEFHPQKPVVLTIGTFDGVHLGHQALLKQINIEAENRGGESYVLTFNPHPRSVLFPNESPVMLIQSIEEKKDKLNRFGLDNLIIYPFTKAFSALAAIEFVEKVLVKQLKVDTLIIGYDHQFGSNREGNIEFLKAHQSTYGYRVIEIEAQTIDELKVSSTRIRKAIEEGDLASVNHFLREPYTLVGQVIKGDQLGRTIGFPTANLKLNEPYKLVPKNGVYAVQVNCLGNKYQGMMNIGVRPTLANSFEKRIEIHMLDVDLDIYDQEIKVSVLAFIREEQKFAGLEELKTKIKEDENWTRNYFLHLQ